MDANQKLQEFMAEVSRRTEQQVYALAERAEAESAAILAETQARCEAEAEREITAAKARIDSKYKKRLSQVGYRGKTTLLSRRQTLLLGLFAELRERIAAFTESERYQSWMESLLKNKQPEPGATILLRAADMHMQEALRRAAGTEVSFREDRAIQLGGLSVLSADGRRCVNHTLDDAFAGQYRGFYRNHSIDGGNE
jgi:vacuolar-type H+-ATPase subunit E/Vma4